MNVQDDSERRHKAVMVEVGDWKAKIDVAIAPLIAAIWRAGIETMMSCQETAPGIAWIEFMSVPDMLDFLNLVARYEPGVDTLYNRINYQRTGNMSAPLWEYQLNLLDIEDAAPVRDEQVFFEATVGVYFPISDIPVILQRLAKAETTSH